MSRLFPDLQLPTEKQRQQLCKMRYWALLEMRVLGWEGKAEQSADLADAFHNLPVYLWSEDFSTGVFREFLKSYQDKYPEPGRFDYLKMLDEIMQEEN
jgi:hypothetical protein